MCARVCVFVRVYMYVWVMHVWYNQVHPLVQVRYSNYTPLTQTPQTHT